MPCAWGWHPYFTFAYETIDHYTLRFPPSVAFALDEAMIPQLEKEPSPYHWLDQSLQGVQLDQVFLANSTKQVEIELKSKIGMIKSTYSEELNYFTLYTPPHRRSIAIEPQSANINALNNLQGLWALEPQEKKTGWVQIQYLPMTSVGETR